MLILRIEKNLYYLRSAVHPSELDGGLVGMIRMIEKCSPQLSALNRLGQFLLAPVAGSEMLSTITSPDRAARESLYPFEG
jgi:hypothetical protein